MGVAVSQPPSSRPSPQRRQRWTCPRCSTVNPRHMYPRCLVCSEEDGDTIELPSVTAWRCNACSMNNPVDYKTCHTCDQRRGASVNRQSNQKRITSGMRPSSVSIYKRREMDETHAEKISHDVLRYCQEVCRKIE